MNRLPHFTKQSIVWYNVLMKSVINPFSSFQSFFQRKLHLVSLFFAHYSVMTFLNTFNLLVALLRLIFLQMVGTQLLHHDHQPADSKYTFSSGTCFQQQLLYCFTLSSNQFLISNISFFSSNFFTYQLKIYLRFDL